MDRRHKKKPPSMQRALSRAGAGPTARIAKRVARYIRESRLLFDIAPVTGFVQRGCLPGSITWVSEQGEPVITPGAER